MVDEILLFFHEVAPIYILFTPAAVVATSVLLVMMMTTPSDSKAAEYKEYIKYVWWAWIILQLCPTFLIMCFNYATTNNAFTW